MLESPFIIMPQRFAFSMLIERLYHRIKLTKQHRFHHNPALQTAFFMACTYSPTGAAASRPYCSIILMIAEPTMAPSALAAIWCTIVTGSGTMVLWFKHREFTVSLVVHHAQVSAAIPDNAIFEILLLLLGKGSALAVFS